MDNLLTITFEAHSQAKNHHRRYEIMIGHDLFHAWTVTINYGRVGQGGSHVRYSSPQLAEMQAVIRNKLRRRLSAPKRLGCSYRLSSFNAAPGFDASTWLPGDVMAKFF